MPNNNDYIEVDYDHISNMTDAAMLVDVGDDKNHWLPNSQAYLDDEVLYVQEWLAMKEGLI